VPERTVQRDWEKARIFLHDSLREDDTSGSQADVGGRLASTGGIWQTVGSPGVTKTGPGTLLFTSLQDNTYTGTTTVREGVLELLHFSSTAVSGSLVIGSGTSTTPTAIVRLRNDDQIDNDSIVQIQTDGLFELGSNNETTGSLTVMGRVTIGNGPAGTSQYIVPALSLMGGTIDIAQNSSLVLGGNTVLATSTAAATARLSGAGNCGSMARRARSTSTTAPKPSTWRFRTNSSAWEAKAS
jgi:autotransporter-associated beta strand protein